MTISRTKTFAISDIEDLEKVDGWWAGLLRNGAKEINSIEWVAKGDLSWTLKIHWAALDNESLPFNVCMPAYSSCSLEELTDVLDEVISERQNVIFHLKMLRKKVEEWGIIEVLPTNALAVEDMQAGEVPLFAEHLVDPTLLYGPKLDLMDKIMASEFLWPSYKNMKRGLLMLDARIEEVKKEIEHRSDSSYTVVYVDRGMLRESFTEQVGYDNKWLFALDEELMDEELLDDGDAEE